MVPSRRRIPTPAWAELPTEPTAGEPFRPFVTGASSNRTVAPIRSVPAGPFPEAQPVLRDDDSDAPKATLF